MLLKIQIRQEPRADLHTGQQRGKQQPQREEFQGNLGWGKRMTKDDSKENGKIDYPIEKWAGDKKQFHRRRNANDSNV